MFLGYCACWPWEPVPRGAFLNPRLLLVGGWNSPHLRRGPQGPQPAARGFRVRPGSLIEAKLKLVVYFSVPLVLPPRNCRQHLLLYPSIRIADGTCFLYPNCRHHLILFPNCRQHLLSYRFVSRIAKDTRANSLRRLCGGKKRREDM